MEKGLTNLAGAIMVVGLAGISTYNGSGGWGVLAVLTWLFYGWRTKETTDNN